VTVEIGVVSWMFTEVLEMESARYSEASVNINRTARHHGVMRLKTRTAVTSGMDCRKANVDEPFKDEDVRRSRVPSRR
jgi:hypothetical protein